MVVRFVKLTGKSCAVNKGAEGERGGGGWKGKRGRVFPFAFSK